MQNPHKSKNNHTQFRLRLHKIPNSNSHPFRLRSKHNYLGFYACCGLLGLTALAMLFPLDINTAKAEDSDEFSTQARLTIGSALAISMSSEIPFKITPSPDGTFGSGSTNVTINTSAKGGYDLFVSSTSGAANSNRMVKTDDATKYVSPISGTNAVTPTTMTNNTWGYAFESGSGIDMSATSRQYKALPITAGTTPVKSGTANTTTSVRSDAYTLGFGAKVDGTLPTGEYTSDITVSVIAKPEQFTHINQLTYMQEMTTKVCAGTPTPYGTDYASYKNSEKQLIDQRDGKAYFVAKMKDGRCWMTQNLALDINGYKTYDGGFKGIAVGEGVPIASSSNGTVMLWKGLSTGTSGPAPKVTESNVGTAANYSNDMYDTRSWDFGKYVLNSPSINGECGGYSSAQNIGSCSSVTNVTNYTQVPYQVYKDGQGHVANTSSTIIGTNNYDAHYLVGNYYMFNTANAGTAGSSLTSGDAPYSICPAGNDSGKNWVIPTSGIFDTLLNQHSATYSTATQPPISFTNSGEIFTSSGYFRLVGARSYYWTRAANDSISAYSQLVSSGYLNSSYTNNYRLDGMHVRCVY